MLMKIVLFTLIFTLCNESSAGSVSIKDSILFGFEKCKELSIDLEKGQLRESVSSSFDVHCKKSKSDEHSFNCDFFETGSDKKILTEEFRGGSDLGIAELKSKTGGVIKFLIGRKFASFKSSEELKACIGIFLFESEAAKKKKEI